ncbi:TPA: hypothetical protein DDZ86_03820 [Candidatus Dependentiae bacterium]|nr:MAG: hypothetical protein UW09_C0003G0118 [candidate division TM6 bacterium GW2011_GWF2_43_87]HBL98744.1 hypothetical protein [Candidatus Dependentiae bacterium]
MIFLKKVGTRPVTDIKDTARRQKMLEGFDLFLEQIEGSFLPSNCLTLRSPPWYSLGGRTVNKGFIMGAVV